LSAPIDRRDHRSAKRWNPREYSTECLQLQQDLAALDLREVTGNDAIAAHSWKSR